MAIKKLPDSLSASTAFVASTASSATSASFASFAAPLSRRRFLRNAGLAAVAGAFFPSLAPASALGRDGKTAPSNRTTLGVVGLVQGWDGFHKCAGRRRGIVQAVALCDVNSRRLGEKLNETRRWSNGKDAKGYRDFREMFESAKLDAVVLGAPDHWHGIMGVAAARKGIHVYGEKPLTHTLKEGRAICDAVKQHAVIWQTGSWQRSVPNFHRAVELVRNGRIGKVVRVEVGTLGNWGARGNRGRSGPAPAHIDYDLWVGPAQWMNYHSGVVDFNWRWVLNFGGGNLMDWVGHHVDIAQWGTDKDRTGPVKIRPVKADFAVDAPFDAARSYEYECTYADGLVMNVNSGNGTKFIGEKGDWIFVTRGRLNASKPSILSEEIGFEEYHPYKSNNHWGTFIDCLRSGKETNTPAETAHRSASVGHLGLISLLVNRTLQWDPATETIANDPAANALLYPAFRAPWAL
ncbi:MAG: Gfo/Idh/MocA family oxidoreductase [Puniceicoccales bacterium]|jgi:predicted dehydrogenase|nr:Gfo/Idh/MocA family oxidoreductase [Puniceicoccales bacterium]